MSILDKQIVEEESKNNSSLMTESLTGNSANDCSSALEEQVQQVYTLFHYACACKDQEIFAFVFERLLD